MVILQIYYKSSTVKECGYFTHMSLRQVMRIYTASVGRALRPTFHFSQIQTNELVLHQSIEEKECDSE